MSGRDETFKPPSLAQHFDAPEEYIGHFGWLCGYSADAEFLNNAAERFSRLKGEQRSHQGSIVLAVLLDPGNPAISLQDAPGVTHLPILDLDKKPFRLLHAKVALLGFRHRTHHGQWRLRLLVSTGNWTRQTLEESLDLVWRIDIDSESLSQPEPDIQQDCADIASAWNLLLWIQKHFDTRLLNLSVSGRLSDTAIVQQNFKQWIKACKQKAQGKPRVFDNRSMSLLAQLPDKIKACGVMKRNYLAMGSGFYEASADQGKPPAVPVEIVNTLRHQGLLTLKPDVDIFVNPQACQAIATAVESLQKQGMTIWQAKTPPNVFGEGAERNLHAKFLFSANKHSDHSDACAHAWVYLGSGNLTHPGFINAMNPNAGNLEAGVVFAPKALYWKKGKTIPNQQVVTNLLPIQWEETIDEASSLSAGSTMEPRVACYVAPPVAWLKWHDAEGVCEIRVDETRTDEIRPIVFDVLDSDGQVCTQTETGFQWHATQPRHVRICWQVHAQRFEALIPMVDSYGRIASTALPSLNIDEAWWQLADFPLSPDEVGSDDGDGGSEENEGSYQPNRPSLPASSYPIRQMMERVESIAAKQTVIEALDWPLWCNRLGQTLEQAAGSVAVEYFRDQLKLNPLSPLRQPSFRPPFAENSDSDLGQLYEETLLRIEAKWHVKDLLPIEVAQ